MVFLIKTKSGPNKGDWEEFRVKKGKPQDQFRPQTLLSREPMLAGQSLWTKFVDKIEPELVDPSWKLVFGEVCLATAIPVGQSQVNWEFPTATSRLYPQTKRSGDFSKTKLRDALKDKGQDCVVWVAFSLRCFRGDLDLGKNASKCCVQIESIAQNMSYGPLIPYRGGLAYKGFLLAKAWAEHKAQLLFGKPIQWQCATDASTTVRNACLLWGFLPIRQPDRCEVAKSEDLEEAGASDGSFSSEDLAFNAKILAKLTQSKWVRIPSIEQ
ncbi:hypothetical protein EBZ37_12170, partial [bacterium]|nr:hypothetical protein [bacterium]